MAEMFVIYTDGACAKNPGGRGGWAYVVLQHGRELRRQSGAVEVSTSNQMEMTAALKALETVPVHSIVLLYSDSQYLVKGMNRWCRAWVRNGWKTKEGQPVKNQELWTMLLQVKQSLQCEFRWVKGHNGDKWNCECDRMANTACGLHSQ